MKIHLFPWPHVASWGPAREAVVGEWDGWAGMFLGRTVPVEVEVRDCLRCRVSMARRLDRPAFGPWASWRKIPREWL